MSKEILEILLDTGIDALKLLPFLFVTYLIMEYIEHKTGDKTKNIIKKSGKWGPVLGAILGIFPQCGFSAAAANLYAGKVITMGTLIAIFLSTSDEMLPILISEAAPVELILKVLAVKLAIGLIAGIVIDCVGQVFRKKREKKEVQEQAKVLLKKMGLEDKADAYPYQLSGGQQQRVSIARALCMNPKILFFDEPTSALDPQLTGEILKVIKDLAAEHMTMVIVTHEMNFARNVADHIVFMENGVIVKEGAPEELFTSDNQRIKEFLGKFQD